MKKDFWSSVWRAMLISSFVFSVVALSLVLPSGYPRDFDIEDGQWVCDEWNYTTKYFVVCDYEDVPNRPRIQGKWSFNSYYEALGKKTDMELNGFVSGCFDVFEKEFKDVCVREVFVREVSE